MSGNFKGSRIRQAGLVLVGVVAGVLVSLNFQAIAQRDRSPLPIEELRAFTEVFGAIKSNYVEPVEDKKLISEAINGMLTGLDPIRPTWMRMRSRSCRSAHRASSAVSASRSAWRTAS